MLYWKWKASSKNNALNYRVRWCSSASKGIIFLFAYWDVSDCFSGKADAIDLKERKCFKLIKVIISTGMASALPLEQWLGVFWQIKNDTLTGSFGFVGFKNGFTIGNSLKVKAIFRTYKSNENTTDVSG